MLNAFHDKSKLLFSLVNWTLSYNYNANSKFSDVDEGLGSFQSTLLSNSILIFKTKANFDLQNKPILLNFSFFFTSVWEFHDLVFFGQYFDRS